MGIEQLILQFLSNPFLPFVLLPLRPLRPPLSLLLPSSPPLLLQVAFRVTSLPITALLTFLSLSADVKTDALPLPFPRRWSSDAVVVVVEAVVVVEEAVVAVEAVAWRRRFSPLPVFPAACSASAQAPASIRASSAAASAASRPCCRPRKATIIIIITIIIIGRAVMVAAAEVVVVVEEARKVTVASAAAEVTVIPSASSQRPPDYSKEYCR